MYFDQLCHENILDRQQKPNLNDAKFILYCTDYHNDSLDVRTNSGTKTG